MIWPFLGAISLATGTIIERLVLMKKKISTRYYQFAQFFSITFIMLLFIPFFWKLSPSFFTTNNILIFLGVIVFSLLANYFTFFSMKWEKLGKLESAKITEPLFVILLSFIFSFLFGTELFGRNPSILIPALIAAFALIFSHIKKHHLTFNKYYLAALLGSLFFATELILSRLILENFNAITFYFFRCLFIVIFSFILLQPKFDKKIESKIKLKILLTGIIWVIYRIIIYYGYINLGVIETTLTIMLGPVFVYLLAWKFLKEKITLKNIISAIVIILCVLYVSFS